MLPFWSVGQFRARSAVSAHKKMEKCDSLFICSTLFGRVTYLGFYIDWLIEMVTVSVGFLAVCVSASIHIGMFFYIHAMVGDMSTRLMAIDALELQQSAHQNGKRFDSPRIWLIYVQEINFHLDIVGYSQFFILFFCLVMNSKLNDQNAHSCVFQ